MKNTSAQFRALLIDFDGVIRYWERPDEAEAAARSGIPRSAIQRVAFDPVRLLPAITGRITDEAWRELVLHELARQFPNGNAIEAVRWWSAPSGRIDADMMTLIQQCRTRVPVVLVTNATTRLPADLATLGLTDAFDAVINSSVVGAAKPDPAIFAAALRAVGVVPSKALFVDDSAGNVAAAQQFGMHGHHFQGYDGLRRQLQEC